MVNHCRFRFIFRESSQSANSSVTFITNTFVRCLCSKFCWGKHTQTHTKIQINNCASCENGVGCGKWNRTSNMPRHRPNVPTTPASSSTSRTAVLAGSSFGSTPPPGTIQLSGLRDDVTNKTCHRKQKKKCKKNEKKIKNKSHWAQFQYVIRDKTNNLLHSLQPTVRICMQLFVGIHPCHRYALNLVFLWPFLFCLNSFFCFFFVCGVFPLPFTILWYLNEKYHYHWTIISIIFPNSVSTATKFSSSSFRDDKTLFFCFVWFGFVLNVL